MRPTPTLFINLYTEMGGGEYGLYHLLEHLDRSRVEPFLVVNGHGPLTVMVERLGIEVIVVPFEVVTLKRFFGGGGFGKNLAAARLLRRIIRERQIGAIVCSDVLSLLLLLPSLLTVSLKVFYNVIFFYELPRLVLFNLLALPFVDHIAVLSGLMRQDLLHRSIGLAGRVSVIYWGVDMERFKPRSQEERKTLRNQLQLPEGNTVIGFIGRYEVWKGHLPFLDAAERLVAKRPGTMILMVGGAITGAVVPDVARYHRRVQERIAAFAPTEALIVWDHRADIPEVMACLDLLVCPSDREPYGLVVLEALACGIPVVVTRTVGALEVFHKEILPFVAEPGSSESIFLAMETALSRSIGGDERSKSAKTVVNWPDWGNYSALVEAKIGV